MKSEERKPTGIVNSAKELRQLIIDNPELPLVVFAGDDANNGDYSYCSCSYVSAYIGEFLDCTQIVNDEKCYCDRDDFEEDLAYMLDDGSYESEENFNKRLQTEMSEYDPYWKKCIVLHVSN